MSGAYSSTSTKSLIATIGGPTERVAVPGKAAGECSLDDVCGRGTWD
ncbi:MAG: hypothetical protein ACRDPA_34535 [Solirubrobacteraceae bacterium]